MELYTAAQMREIDRIAIEERGIPSIELMENAARAVVQEVLSLPIPGPRALKRREHRYDKDGRERTLEEQAEFWAVRQRSAVVVCGTGNNGGDGLAAARMLLERGWRVTCCVVGDREKMTDDCREMERRLLEAGGEVRYNKRPGRACFDADVAIDALYGVGLDVERDMGLLAYRMIQEMRHAGWVVSVDVPSGIHADTGASAYMAVKADVTVTFSAGKLGLFLGDGALHSGRVVVADIGIPRGDYQREGSRTFLARPGGRPAGIADFLGYSPKLLELPDRPADGHKGDFGKLFILAGSRGYTGAAALCARAAVRGGVGLVTVAVPEDIYPIVAAKCDEAMVWPWSEDDDELIEKAKGCTAAVIGPGLGQGERAERLVLRLMRELICPIVLDADGLNIISRHINVLDEREHTTILTPHDGEFARLSGCELPIGDRLGAARAFALEHGCTLVLKGHRTITAKPVEDGMCFINDTGNSGMAKGGSGDVLAGLIGSMSAQAAFQGRGMDKSVLAVWLHGRAGDLAAEDKGEYGMTPSDLIEQIPYAIKELT